MRLIPPLFRFLPWLRGERRLVSEEGVLSAAMVSDCFPPGLRRVRVAYVAMDFYCRGLLYLCGPSGMYCRRSSAGMAAVTSTGAAM